MEAGLLANAGKSQCVIHLAAAAQALAPSRSSLRHSSAPLGQPVQREGDVKNLIAGKLEDLTPMLGRLATESRDFK